MDAQKSKRPGGKKKRSKKRPVTPQTRALEKKELEVEKNSAKFVSHIFRIKEGEHLHLKALEKKLKDPDRPVNIDRLIAALQSNVSRIRISGLPQLHPPLKPLPHTARPTGVYPSPHVPAPRMAGLWLSEDKYPEKTVSASQYLLPGPGQYKIPTTMTSDKVIYILGRPGPGGVLPNETPGPGAYTFATGPVSWGGQAASLHSRLPTDHQREIEAQRKPGPGAYDVETSFKPKVALNSSWVRENERKVRLPAPGPASYQGPAATQMQ